MAFLLPSVVARWGVLFSSSVTLDRHDTPKERPSYRIRNQAPSKKSKSPGEISAPRAFRLMIRPSKAAELVLDEGDGRDSRGFGAHGAGSQAENNGAQALGQLHFLFAKPALRPDE